MGQVGIKRQRRLATAKGEWSRSSNGQWENGRRLRLLRNLRREMRGALQEAKYRQMEEGEKKRLGRYDPLVALALLAVDPRSSASIKALCHAELARYFYGDLRRAEVMQAVQDNRIVVTVAGYAASGPAALPAPEAVVPEVTE